MKKKNMMHKMNYIFLILIVVILCFLTYFFANKENLDNKNMISSKPTLNPKTVGYKKNEHLCRRIILDENYLVGKWNFSGNTEGNKPIKATIVLLDDDSLTFTGFYNEDFKSVGKWSYTGSDNTLKLIFLDNLETFGKDINENTFVNFKESEKEHKYDSGIKNMRYKKENYVLAEFKIIKDGFSPQNVCNISINFLGWTFTNIVRAEDVLSGEELEEYKEVMGID